MSLLHAHPVFVTNYRRPVFTDAMLTFTETTMRNVCVELGVELGEFTGETDHAHLLVAYPPTPAISVLGQRLKGRTAYSVRRGFTGACVRAHMPGHLSSPSYLAVSRGGAPLSIIKQYIDGQARPLRTPGSARRHAAGPPLVPASRDDQSEKMTEQWIKGCEVQRINFRHGLVLNLDDYNELVISVPFHLRLPAVGSDDEEVVLIDPTAIKDVERPLFDFSGRICTHADWDEDGSLHLRFSDGHEIHVHSDERRTAWELYGKTHGYAACLPHGEVRVVRHDLVEGDDDSAER